MTSDLWRKYMISADSTHHVLDGSSAYPQRLIEVLKFDEPGLAPVLDEIGAYRRQADGCRSPARGWFVACGQPVLEHVGDHDACHIPCNLAA